MLSISKKHEKLRIWTGQALQQKRAPDYSSSRYLNAIAWGLRHGSKLNGRVGCFTMAKHAEALSSSQIWYGSKYHQKSINLSFSNVILCKASSSRLKYNYMISMITLLLSNCKYTYKTDRQRECSNKIMSYKIVSGDTAREAWRDLSMWLCFCIVRCFNLLELTGPFFEKTSPVSSDACMEPGKTWTTWLWCSCGSVLEV